MSYNTAQHNPRCFSSCRQCRWRLGAVQSMQFRNGTQPHRSQPPMRWRPNVVLVGSRRTSCVTTPRAVGSMCLSFQKKMCTARMNCRVLTVWLKNDGSSLLYQHMSIRGLLRLLSTIAVKGGTLKAKYLNHNRRLRKEVEFDL